MNNVIEPHAPKLKSGADCFHLSTLPKCGARTRSGEPCKHYGTKHNGRCRLHGGRSTGAKDQTGERNPGYIHGFHTREAMQQRRELRLEVAALIKQCKSFMAEV